MKTGKRIVLLTGLMLIASVNFAQQTILYYLSGKDKDHTVSWDFFCTRGMNSGKWSTIPVPSNWELQKFGTYNYSRDTENPDEQGLYKYKFPVAAAHKGKRIFIVFEGSMTDTEVKINGVLAGPVHQGAFYQFRYDITDLLYFGKINLLEVTVSKHSANASVNRAERKSDFWIFGGIFRPVYLEIVPQTFIRRVVVDGKANGDFFMQVYSNATPKQVIEAQVFQLDGKPVGEPLRLLPGDSILRHHFSGMKLWSPEYPNLYSVMVSVREGNKVIHSIKERFGFRTVELRSADGFYANGVKVIFKGVCRHSEWPESGRTLSRAVHLMDIRLMKSMNMNAVRMSHYPPDKEFLDLCDSLGLFVLDELTGWQAAYDTVVGQKLVKEMVIRDVNHPSIVIWDNGNEGGWNRALDNEYALYDPQKRIVIHPWERFNGTNTKHYPDFKYIQNEIATGKEVFFPTEFMHGLFDGGHGAALEDFWNLLLTYNRFAGAFLWSLHDEGIVRTDKNNSIDVAGNQAPDGIVGPHREKEASFYTIRELWSPVYINSSVKPFDPHRIEIENRYLYTNLDQCRFEWKTVLCPVPSQPASLSRIVNKGSIKGPSVTPGQKGWLNIPLSSNVNADVVYLSALSAKGDTICTWSWPLHDPSTVAAKLITVAMTAGVIVREDERSLSVSCDKIAYFFDKETGYLQKVFNGKKNISLNNGPALAGSNVKLTRLHHYREGNNYIVESSYEGDSLQVKWIIQSGTLPRMEYKYLVRDIADYTGITFNYPEENITGMKWMGRGPYRVWKNRLKGQQLGVWEKTYNNTITGESWDYPEFKGWHEGMYWVKVKNKEADFTVITDQENMFFEMLKPARPKAAPNNNTVPAFPEGNIGFMHAISPIGTKFQKPEVLGPSSQKNIKQDSKPVSGTLYFDFR